MPVRLTPAFQIQDSFARFLGSAGSWCSHNWSFLLLFAAVLISRFSILLNAQNHVHSDEAIIGLMARHILELKDFPVYFYGEPYNGGAAMEAYMTAPLFYFLGTGVKPLKLTIVLMSVCSWIFFYALVKRFWNRRIAWIASALFAFAPTLLPWHFQVRGGYGEYHLFMFAILYTTFSLAEEDRPPTYAYLLFGICFGMALWSFELILPFVAVCIVYLAAVRRRLFRDRRLFLTAVLAPAGYFPALCYNLTHRGANWAFILQRRLGSGKGFVTFFSAEMWREILVHDLPRFFGPETVLWYKSGISPSGIVFYALGATSLAFAFVRYARKNAGFFGQALKREQVGTTAFRETLLLLLILSCLVPYAVVPKRVPSYLIGIIPLLSILAADFIDTFIGSGRRLLNAIGIAVLLAPLGFGTFEYVKFFHTDYIESLELTPDGYIAPTTISGSSLAGAIAYLQERAVPAVFASPSLQYPIIFESGEKIVASSNPLPFRYSVYRDYDKRVVRIIREHPAFVIEADSPLKDLATSIIRRLTSRQVSITRFDEILVIEAEGP
jgi:4-amino-4-deoxy-L-arabinose transferase-like glycosyltransferase